MKFIFFILIAVFLPFVNQAQMIFAKIVASSIEFKMGPEHYPTYYYTFKVEKIIDQSYINTTPGNFSDDFDTTSTLKIQASKIGSEPKKILLSKDPIIIKLIKVKTRWHILWMSEIEREEEFDQLDKVFFSLVEAVDQNNYKLIKPFLFKKSILNIIRFKEITRYHKRNNYSIDHLILMNHIIDKEEDHAFRVYTTITGKLKYYFLLTKKENSKEGILIDIIKYKDEED